MRTSRPQIPTSSPHPAQPPMTALQSQASPVYNGSANGQVPARPSARPNIPCEPEPPSNDGNRPRNSDPNPRADQPPPRPNGREIKVREFRRRLKPHRLLQHLLGDQTA